MSQKELVYWIAFHKLEREERGEPREDKKPGEKKVETKITVKQPSQKQKDNLLLQQLFAIVSARKKKRESG